jgi:hypothetical protein
MGLFFAINKTSWGGMGGMKFFALKMAPNISLNNVQKNDFHNEQVARLFDSRLWDLSWLKIGPSHCCVAQIGTSSNEMSHANCLNLNAYTDASHDP